ncbi:hypothetical protein GCM10009131_09740 [Morganella psychrotolerans]
MGDIVEGSQCSLDHKTPGKTKSDNHGGLIVHPEVHISEREFGIERDRIEHEHALRGTGEFTLVFSGCDW